MDLAAAMDAYSQLMAEILREGKPEEVLQRDWQTFSHRTKQLDLACKKTYELLTSAIGPVVDSDAFAVCMTTCFAYLTATFDLSLNLSTAPTIKLAAQLGEAVSILKDIVIGIQHDPNMFARRNLLLELIQDMDKVLDITGRMENLDNGLAR